MKLFQKIVTMLALLGGVTAGAQAQVLIGGFQGSTDPTDYGWTENGTSITNNSNCNFVAAGIPGFADSLVIGGAGTFGNPSSLSISLNAAQVQQFLNNSWLTFTFSIPASAATGGYNQLYNVQFQYSGAGYGAGSTNWMSGGNAAATWGTYSMAVGNTNNNQHGEPNYYLYSGYPMMSQTVTFNYSGLTNDFIASGSGYLNILFQGNTGGGSVATQIWNSVVLSQAPFGAAVEAPPGEYVMDDFSTNGVGNLNPTNFDYFDNTNEIYLDGSITNVYGNWFGGGFQSVAFSTNSTPNAFDPAGYPAHGSLQINVDPNNGQWVLHHSDYSPNPNVNSLVYTDVEMDVMFDPSSAVGITGGSTNYGPLRLGVRPAGVFSVQDWFYYAPVVTNGNNGWVHIVAPLNPQDANQQTWGELLIGMDAGSAGWVGSGTGNQIIYVDNIVFKGPVSVKIPPTTLSIQKATPGLRIYAGSTVNTFDREDLVTIDENQSWIGGTGYPVTYSFSLLSYPPSNIAQTMLELYPPSSITNGANAYGQEYGDYQAGNGLWLVLAPFGGGQVTAAVEWKTNLSNANPANGTVTPASNPNAIALLVTNTAVGTWTLTFNSANTGTLTPPGGPTKGFTIADPNISSDFANPVIAQFGLQPNSQAGEGLYETWGFIAVSNVADGPEYENFTQESSDLFLSVNSGYWTTPSGFFETANSANQNSSIIIRSNLDIDVVSWTSPASGYNLVEGTNLLLSPLTHWVTPDYYSSGNDSLAPRGVSQLEGPNFVEVIPADNAPTVNGQPGGPIAPNAFFILTTNAPSANP